MMNAELARVGVVLALSLAVAVAVVAGRWLVARRRQRVLAAAPALAGLGLPPAAGDDVAPVRILVFSSDDCAQCHRLQAPAIQKVLAARGPAVATIEVDAPSSPEMTARYQILTLPSTAILDATGKTRAINYGFASSTKLLQQIDDILASNPAGAAV